MNRYIRSQQGSVTLVLVAVVAVVFAVGAGLFVWQRNKNQHVPAQKQNDTNQKQMEQKDLEQDDETKNWSEITTQAGKFSMKVPDGWTMTAYPDDFLGSFDVSYDANVPAVLSTSNTEYVGHVLRFRASVTPGNTDLGPQWSSPQPGLEESTQDFSIGTIKGKRYKAVFTGDLNQTLYQYIFDLGDRKKLDIVYIIYSNNGEKDEVDMVEKAIKTIQLN
jgi:hypothetical protein